MPTHRETSQEGHDSEGRPAAQRGSDHVGAAGKHAPPGKRVLAGLIEKHKAGHSLAA